MQVSVEDIPEVTIGSKGILIRIKDNQGKNQGKLWIGKANVRWARGSKPERSAKTLTVEDFVDYLNNLP